MWVEDKAAGKWYENRVPLSRKLKMHPDFKVLDSQKDMELGMHGFDDEADCHSEKAYFLQKLYPDCSLGWLPEYQHHKVTFREVIYIPYDWARLRDGLYAFVDELEAPGYMERGLWATCDVDFRSNGSQSQSYAASSANSR